MIETPALPSELYVGQPISIELNVFDYDNDPIQLGITQQLGMGDRYAGKDYVTAQKLENLVFNGNQINLLARYPGNYRLIITASDKDGTTQEGVDVPVKWAPGENPFRDMIRAIIVDTYGPPSWHTFSLFPQLIERSKAIGMNAVMIDPYIANVNDDFYYCDQVGDWCTTPSDEVIEGWINYARSQDFEVILKPHLIADEGRTESWAIVPSNTDKWFHNYSDKVISKYAGISRQTSVIIFCVGNELSEVARPPFREFWVNQVIPAARNQFSGHLTYSDVNLWVVGGTGAWLSTFWDELDFTGVPFYYLGSEHDNDPAVEEMRDYILPQLYNNLTTAANQYRKAVFVTEFGKPNLNGTNYDHWTWDVARGIDNQEQVDYAEAGLQALLLWQADTQIRIHGIAFMIYKPKPLEHVGGTTGLDWDIRGQPIEKSLSLWLGSGL